MDSTNMLSATKTKQHGLTSTKWTTKDKIIQYKGLINLYTRDKKIMETDVNIAKRRQTQELKMLHTEINLNRKNLDNACGGDKQKLRNALAEHRVLQLAYCRSTPKKVIDAIHQVSFTKRKKRDILSYKMKIESDKLIDLKLRCSILEDRLIYESDTLLPSEKLAHLVTGRVQDAILKKEAAIYIRNSYRDMIAVMKKDAIYFDAILASLKNDGLAQGKCMLNATKLGQLGIEYLDDRRQEYQCLEGVVKTDLSNRKKDISIVQNNMEAFEANLKNLIRRDSDVNLGKVTLEESKSFHLLQSEIKTIEGTLKFMQESLFTQNFDQIYPCLKEQRRQKEKLAQLIIKSELSRDDLKKKLEKTDALYAELSNTMVETTKAYNAEKVTLNTEIKNEIEKANEYESIIQTRYGLLAKIRIALKHLQYLARLLANPQEAGIKPSKILTAKYSGIVAPDQEEIDGMKIIPELKQAFAKLAGNAPTAREVLTATKTDLTYRAFELLMRDRSKPIEVSVKVSEEAFMDADTTDTSVPSHEDIKKVSAEIVIEGLAALEYKPPPPPTKKKYKFKK